MSSTHAVKRIAIVGSGLNFWMSICQLISSIKGLNYEFTAVETETQSEVGIISTLPSLKIFNDDLGISEGDFIRATSANFHLAINYINWSEKNKSFYLPFSSNGFSYNGFDFVYFYTKNKLFNSELRFDDYNLTAQAAKLDKFSHALPDKSQTIYGYQIDIQKAVDFYKSLAKKCGVIHVAATTISATLGKNGIESLKVDALEHKADFFIDVTPQGLLIDSLSDEKIEYIPSFNRCAKLVESSSCSPSSTILERRERAVKSTVCSSLATSRILRYRVEDESNALESFSREVGTRNFIVEDDFAFFRKKLWVHNCVAFGEAAFSFHSILSVETWLTQSFVTRFLNLFPRTQDYSSESLEFNRLSNLQLERIVAFYAAHIVSCGISVLEGYEEYQDKLKLFLARGVIPFYEGEIFTESYWQSFLFGCDYCPASTSDLISYINEDWLVKQLSNMKTMMLKAALSMPKQADYRHEFIKRG